MKSRFRFFPGYGECVVVHVGENQWLIVDSCRNPRTGNPIASDYLESLGLEFSAVVRLIVATHWHDDHMEGLADLVSKASAVQFVFLVPSTHRSLEK